MRTHTRPSIVGWLRGLMLALALLLAPLLGLAATPAQAASGGISVVPGLTFGYIPLSAFGGNTIFPLGDNDVTDLDVPDFVYAGQTYTKLGIASNGFLVVGGGVTAADLPSVNHNLPGTALPNNLLAPFWTDLNPGNGGRILANVLTDGIASWIVVEWEAVPEATNPSQLNTFQVWIGINGTQDVSFAYNGVGSGANGLLTVGAENADGSSGQTVYYNGVGTPPAAGTGWLVTDTVAPDTAAPTASPTQSPAANGAGWNKSDVTVSWNWADNAGGSGIDTANCTTSSTSSGEGTLELTANCADLASNQGSASYTVKVDKTAPTISAATTSAPNAAGWYNTPVAIHFMCADTLSGVASCPADQTLTVEGSAVSSTGQSVSDVAGNASAPSNVVTVQIDRSAPAVSITGVTNGASYTLGAVPAAACSTSDALSGVATQATLSLSGTGVGAITARCAGAADVAGNQAAAVSVSYAVGYSFSGFSSPVDNLPTVNTANAGRSIPLKWRLADASGNPITNLSGVSVTSAAGGCSAGAPADGLEEYATTTSGLQNLGNGYYQFNWKTEKSWAGSCRTLRLDLGGGQVVNALFRFS